ncbi:hypothetical protein CN602_28930 [Bacillus cereus]|nr:hypothetical protein CN602_28930 [Bacillus cereus]
MHSKFNLTIIFTTIAVPKIKDYFITDVQLNQIVKQSVKKYAMKLGKFLSTVKKTVEKNQDIGIGIKKEEISCVFEKGTISNKRVEHLLN